MAYTKEEVKSILNPIDSMDSRCILEIINKNQKDIKPENLETYNLLIEVLKEKANL